MIWFVRGCSGSLVVVASTRSNRAESFLQMHVSRLGDHGSLKLWVPLGKPSGNRSGMLARLIRELRPFHARISVTTRPAMSVRR